MAAMARFSCFSGWGGCASPGHPWVPLEGRGWEVGWVHAAFVGCDGVQLCCFLPRDDDESAPPRLARNGLRGLRLTEFSEVR